jgi:hypothetical protein
MQDPRTFIRRQDQTNFASSGTWPSQHFPIEHPDSLQQRNLMRQMNPFASPGFNVSPYMPYSGQDPFPVGPMPPHQHWSAYHTVSPPAPPLLGRESYAHFSQLKSREHPSNHYRARALPIRSIRPRSPTALDSNDVFPDDSYDSVSIEDASSDGEEGIFDKPRGKKVQRHHSGRPSRASSRSPAPTIGHNREARPVQDQSPKKKRQRPFQPSRSAHCSRDCSKRADKSPNRHYPSQSYKSQAEDYEQRLEAESGEVEISIVANSEEANSGAHFQVSLRPSLKTSTTGRGIDKHDGVGPNTRQERTGLATISADLILRLDEARKKVKPKLSARLQSRTIGQTVSTQTESNLASKFCASKEDTHNSQESIVEQKRSTSVLVPNPNESPAPSSPSHSPPVTADDLSHVDTPADSSASDWEDEEEQSSNRLDEGREQASEECGISVENALITAMNVIKGLLLQDVLNHASSEARDAPEGAESTSSRSQSASVNTSTNSSNTSPSTPSSQQAQRAKRTRCNDRDPGDGNGSGSSSEDESRPKKKNDKASPDRLPPRRLKCPFYQRQPEMYTKAACRGAGFLDMAKLKDHLKRDHQQPLRCVRCWLEMPSEPARLEHLQQDSRCERIPEPHDERIHPHVLKQLNFKKAPYATAKSVEEKWGLLFKALFPGEPEVPSPCKPTPCGVLLARLTAADEHEAMSSKLIKLLAKVLEEVLTRELAHVLGPMMSRIKARVPAIIQSCRLELLRTSTPSTGSSHQGSSDGDLWSRGSPATSPHSASSCEMVPGPEKCASTALAQLAPSSVPLPFFSSPQVAAPPVCFPASGNQDTDTFFTMGYNASPALNSTDYQSNASLPTMCMNVSSDPALACGDMHCMFCKAGGGEWLPACDPLSEDFDFGKLS